jgi:dCMP deaminase
MSRPDWDNYFLRITRDVQRRSTCLRRPVGAVLVRDKHILATGYNGAPSGLPHCDVVGCIRDRNNVPSGERHELCRGLHAEMNAVIQAAYHGTAVKGATLYSTTHPCSLCAKTLINVGIAKVVVEDDYPDDLSKKLFKEAGIEVAVKGTAAHKSKTGLKKHKSARKRK